MSDYPILGRLVLDGAIISHITRFPFPTLVDCERELCLLSYIYIQCLQLMDVNWQAAIVPTRS